MPRYKELIEKKHMHRRSINIISGDLIKILVINLGGIGDVLLSTPALMALRSLYPRSCLCLLVAEQVVELTDGLPYIDKVFVLNLNFGLFGALNNLRTLLSLRKKNIDIALNMRTLVSKISAFKIKFLLDIINPKLRIGRNTEGRGDFFDIKIHETDSGEKYEMEYDIETVTLLGAQVIDRGVDFMLNEDSIRKTREILEEEGIYENDMLIGIHPGGKQTHRWPIENFSKVIDEIHKKIPVKFIITGEWYEANLANKLKKITNTGLISMVGKLNIQELATLLKRCNLYISNDTGPIHIAAILKTPLIAIFGPGDIIRYDPRNISDKTIVLYKKFKCSPCNKLTCRSLQCLKTISPREIIEAAINLLGGVKSGEG